jgi:hypothetical protein
MMDISLLTLILEVMSWRYWREKGDYVSLSALR